MAINFNDRVLVVNPTSYFIGRSVLGVGIVTILLGIVTQFTGDFLEPSALWVPFGIPAAVAGGILMWSALRKN